jgi:NAD+ synthase
MNFHKDVLVLDAAAETDRIVTGLRHAVRSVMRRHGGVVGISGGIDSALVLALGVRAFGPDKITALMLPEKDSDPLSERLARELAAKFGVQPIREDIAPALEGYGCYRRRDEAIKRVFPQYDAKLGYKAKIVLPQNLLDSDAMNFFSVTIVAPDGTEMTKPLPAPEYLQIVAASNLKQRTRMSMLYYHAELRNYAVLGTANKNEHDQGFFVKYGDSGVDIQTIGHLYKTQVYQLARHLGVPESILQRTPTTDTYSAPCTQEEFFFRIPFKTMDLLWYALEHGVPAAEAAPVMGLTETQVQRAYTDIGRKQRATEPLRMRPVDLVAAAKV